MLCKSLFPELLARLASLAQSSCARFEGFAHLEGSEKVEKSMTCHQPVLCVCSHWDWKNGLCDTGLCGLRERSAVQGRAHAGYSACAKRSSVPRKGSWTVRGLKWLTGCPSAQCPVISRVYSGGLRGENSSPPLTANPGGYCQAPAGAGRLGLVSNPSVGTHKPFTLQGLGAPPCIPGP